MLARKKTVYVGADIITLSDACPRAEAVCVADGRIDCLGSREDVLEYARPGGCEIVDLGGGTLYPGFIDTHSHMSSFSNCLRQVYCGSSLRRAASLAREGSFHRGRVDRRLRLRRLRHPGQAPYGPA